MQWHVWLLCRKFVAETGAAEHTTIYTYARMLVYIECDPLVAFVLLRFGCVYD